MALELNSIPLHLSKFFVFSRNRKKLNSSNLLQELSPSSFPQAVEGTTYEICPYATFCPAPMGNPFPGAPTANPDEGDVMDYSLQFQTFGHQDCLEGQHLNTVSPGGGYSSSSSSSGWLFLRGRRAQGGGVNAKRDKLPGGKRKEGFGVVMPVDVANRSGFCLQLISNEMCCCAASELFQKYQNKNGIL